MPGPSDLLILCYHAVSASWPTDFAVAPEVLERQVGGLLRRGYRPMTLSAALESDGAAGKALVVTFDDAYRSVIEAGLPVLSSLGAPATVFVPTSFASSPRPMVWAEMAEWEGTDFEAELEPMSWEELRQLSGLGWEIGSPPSCATRAGNAKRSWRRPAVPLPIPSPATTPGSRRRPAPPGMRPR
jgi:peptidoglycan/xylan/chitin deacetylase (PgdA/CDA1 family)